MLICKDLQLTFICMLCTFLNKLLKLERKKEKKSALRCSSSSKFCSCRSEMSFSESSGDEFSFLKDESDDYDLSLSSSDSDSDEIAESSSPSSAPDRRSVHNFCCCHINLTVCSFSLCLQYIALCRSKNSPKWNSLVAEQLI